MNLTTLKPSPDVVIAGKNALVFDGADVQAARARRKTGKPAA